eukprot:CAMPEP_0113832114 /NCGR_PEP_ID=MMETSP0328-20130328/7208_1 /TAXON_ID=39455 /ORGANISM="Alexandrium minutum" /LENGTH=65 /DNA_ID=CAMNT_0000800309 /DNA_START=66 /DNA_END=260 /DNA_ORIENTATION=- /assembly_acc=CAM_ASM_000350
MGDHCNYLHGITFEEADFDSSCIPAQPSPWPMVATIAVPLLGLLACCGACRACGKAAQARARDPV